MVNKRHLLLATVVLLIGLAGIWVVPSLFQSEEKKVKKQFRLLSEYVSKAPGESAFTLAQKTQNIRALFAERFELTSASDFLAGIYTPEEATGLAARARLPFSELNLAFYEFDISFPETDTAKVLLTARLTGRLATGEAVDEMRELEALLKKVEKKWLFSRVEVIEVLKK